MHEISEHPTNSNHMPQASMSAILISSLHFSSWEIFSKSLKKLKKKRKFVLAARLQFKQGLYLR